MKFSVWTSNFSYCFCFLFETLYFYSLKPGSEPTGMLLYKIKPLSGHSIDLEDNRNQNSAKIVEFDKGTANFYYDQVKNI